MAAKTRKDRFGRLLAPSRFNPRSEIVVETSAEKLDDRRQVALGVKDQPKGESSGDEAKTDDSGGGKGSGGKG